MTTDMRHVTAPKSDQLNADDLLGGSRTITITKVQLSPGTEQPVSVFFEGDDGKPYKPCKSMARLMMATWGADSSVYVGRSMTLYNDPTVKWGGIAVGGIRISHLSHIDRDMTIALTATRGKKSPYTVKMLAARTDDTAARQALANATTLDELRTAWSAKAMAPFRDALAGYLEQRKAELSQSEDTPADKQQEEADAGEASDTDEGEVWRGMVDGWKSRLFGNPTVTDIAELRSEFNKNAFALPDEVNAEIDGLLTEAAYKFTQGE